MLKGHCRAAAATEWQSQKSQGKSWRAAHRFKQSGRRPSHGPTAGGYIRQCRRVCHFLKAVLKRSNVFQAHRPLKIDLQVFAEGLGRHLLEASQESSTLRFRTYMPSLGLQNLFGDFAPEELLWPASPAGCLQTQTGCAPAAPGRFSRLATHPEAYAVVVPSIGTGLGPHWASRLQPCSSSRSAGRSKSDRRQRRISPILASP